MATRWNFSPRAMSTRFMGYRTDGFETARRDAAAASASLEQELGLVAQDAVRRKRRAWALVAASVVGVFALPLGILARATHQPKLACHRTTIQWENAPETPGPTWMVCRER
jgi:hypothetical protein